MLFTCIYLEKRLFCFSLTNFHDIIPSKVGYCNKLNKLQHFQNIYDNKL